MLLVPATARRGPVRGGRATASGVRRRRGVARHDPAARRRHPRRSRRRGRARRRRGRRTAPRCRRGRAARLRAARRRRVVPGRRPSPTSRSAASSAGSSAASRRSSTGWPTSSRRSSRPRAAARYAADALAAGDPDAPIGRGGGPGLLRDVAVHAAEECVQLHGGHRHDLGAPGAPLPQAGQGRPDRARHPWSAPRPPRNARGAAVLIGVLKESRVAETRVSATPATVAQLLRLGTRWYSSRVRVCFELLGQGVRRGGRDRGIGGAGRHRARCESRRRANSWTR